MTSSYLDEVAPSTSNIATIAMSSSFRMDREFGRPNYPILAHLLGGARCRDGINYRTKWLVTAIIAGLIRK